MATLTELAAKTLQTPQEQAKFPTTHYKPDPVELMLACEFRGKQSMKLVTRPKPTVTDPADCVIRVTTTTVCGYVTNLRISHVTINNLKIF